MKILEGFFKKCELNKIKDEIHKKIMTLIQVYGGKGLGLKYNQKNG